MIQDLTSLLIQHHSYIRGGAYIFLLYAFIQFTLWATSRSHKSILRLEKQESAPDLPGKPVQILDPGDLKPVPSHCMADLQSIDMAFAIAEVPAKLTKLIDGPIATYYFYTVAVNIRSNLLNNATINSDLSRAVGREAVLDHFVAGTTDIRVSVMNPKVVPVMWDEQGMQPPSSKYIMSILLGVDTYGKPLYYDLVELQHILIGGFTGGGKSVLLQGMICYLLAHYTPQRLRIVMIDMKLVELSRYSKVPHLASPVVSSLPDAPGLLIKLVSEMNRRLELFSQRGYQNITQYYEDHGKDSMPIIWVVIDEAADILELLPSNQVNKMSNNMRSQCNIAVNELARKARAVGIFMLLCTQNPKVSVITSDIKTNCTKIALKCKSSEQSRVIRGDDKALKLMGKGHALIENPTDSTDTVFNSYLVTRQMMDKVMGLLNERQQCERDLPLNKRIWHTDFMFVDQPVNKEDIEYAHTNGQDVVLTSKGFTTACIPYNEKLAKHPRYKDAIIYCRTQLDSYMQPDRDGLSAYLKQKYGRAARNSSLYDMIQQIINHELKDHVKASNVVKLRAEA